MYHFGSFHLRDMTACGAASPHARHRRSEFRRRSPTALFGTSTIIDHGPDPGIGLRPGPIVQDDPLLPSHAGTSRPRGHQARETIPDHPSLTCLTLIASAGVVPGWNDPACSSRFRSHPARRPRTIAQLPMFSQLFQQLNFRSLNLQHGTTIAPRLAGTSVQCLSRFSGRRKSLYPCPGRIRTSVRRALVLGFGAPLPNGDFFSVILFSKQVIPEATAQLFKPLALCAQIALARHVATTPLPPASVTPQPTVTRNDSNDAVVAQLSERIVELERSLTCMNRRWNDKPVGWT